MSEEGNGKQWFVIHTYAGSEDRIKANLEQRIRSMRAEDIFQVVVPTEEEVEIREGKRVSVKKKCFPGYVLVEMRMNPDSWKVVRNTPGVTGFVGADSKPVPLTKEEVEAVLSRRDSKTPRIKVEISKGEAVRIKEGPFADFIGKVDEISPDKGRAKVLVSFFGRETPVELDFLQLERL